MPDATADAKGPPSRAAFGRRVKLEGQAALTATQAAMQRFLRSLLIVLRYIKSHPIISILSLVFAAIIAVANFGKSLEYLYSWLPTPWSETEPLTASRGTGAGPPGWGDPYASNVEVSYPGGQTRGGDELSRPEKIAILVQGLDSWNDRQDVEDAFTERALDLRYRVAARSDIEAVVEEIRFQKSGLTDKDAVDIGRILNVPVVLIVSVISREPCHERISARMVSVEMGEIIWIVSGKALDCAEENEGLRLVAQEIAWHLPEDDVDILYAPPPPPPPPPPLNQ